MMKKLLIAITILLFNGCAYAGQEIQFDSSDAVKETFVSEECSSVFTNLGAEHIDAIYDAYPIRAIVYIIKKGGNTLSPDDRKFLLKDLIEIEFDGGIPSLDNILALQAAQKRATHNQSRKRKSRGAMLYSSMQKEQKNA